MSVYAPHSLVGKGRLTLLFRGRWRGFDPRQLQHTTVPSFRRWRFEMKRLWSLNPWHFRLSISSGKGIFELENK